jgi:hypothetical protein
MNVKRGNASQGVLKVTRLLGEEVAFTFHSLAQKCVASPKVEVQVPMIT